MVLDDASDDASDVRVLRASLRGLAPQPTWNGTVAAPSSSEAGDGRCSLLCENGDVVVLRAAVVSQQRGVTQPSSSEADCTRLCVDKIVRAPPVAAASMGDDAAKSVCQCWSADASVFATAHGRRVTFYSTVRGFELLRCVQLRYCVASMAIARLHSTSSSSSESDTPSSALACRFVVGTAFGAHLYELALSGEPSSSQDGSRSDTSDGAGDSTLPVPLLLPLASAYSDVPVCFVTLAPDSRTVALGTVDGRMFVRELPAAAHTASTTTVMTTTVFGCEVFAKVLASPRVTSMSFSPCSTKLAVATRKGHVYVLTRRRTAATATTAVASSTRTWQLHAPCKNLSETPKPPATSSASSATASASAAAAVAMQTLVCWWGSAAAAVLVVASRAVNYHIELFDAASGALVHSVRIEPPSAAASGSATGDDLLIGLCSLAVRGAASDSLQLVCQDTQPSIALVSWPMLDIWTGGG